MKSNFLDPGWVVQGTQKLRNTFPVLMNGVKQSTTLYQSYTHTCVWFYNTSPYYSWDSHNGEYWDYCSSWRWRQQIPWKCWLTSSNYMVLHQMNWPVPAAFVPTLCPELQWPSVYPNPTCPTAETLPLPVDGGQIPVGKQHQFVLPTYIHNYTTKPYQSWQQTLWTWLNRRVSL